ncbi:MAG: hypothetical protein L6Q54_06655 [Leptospiraceae bacterium]|nr:hypothetical protein [Leptospiraceae bacterium]MCK6380917.1 hypothetical protein [Leptospiraceae bacterium]NUM40027.1 hypothetical protein [Leptospiraceae bacterium]
MSHDVRFSVNPFTHLNGYINENRYFAFQTRQSHALKPDFLYQIPIIGRGFIEYEKIGKKVSYFSSNQEILWQKDFMSYPKPSYEGNLILLASGDNNRVFLSDLNGNWIGEKVIDGRFLSDYSFAQNNGGAILLFSGGEVVRLNEKGNRVFYKDFKKKTLSFYKSIAISPNGQFSAIHYLNEDKDFILLLDQAGDEVATLLLHKVYPHKVFMAIGNLGNLQVNLPDSIFLYEKSGKLLRHIQKKKRSDIYQLSFHTGEYFVASNVEDIYFFDNDANILKIQKGISFPVRAIPSKSSKEIFLETKNEIFQFSLFN